MDSNSLEQLAQLELRYKKFSLVGTGEVQASGSLKTGFAVNVIRASSSGGTTPEPPTGACCEGLSCSITTFGDCVGSWRGPGTICDPNPCHLPCCPSPTLVCDSISASKSKCGFTEYVSPSTPPKYYLVETYSSLQTTSPESCLDSNHNFTCDPSLNCVANRTITYDSSTCSPTTVGSSDPGAAGNTAHEERCNGTVIDPTGDCNDYDITIRGGGTRTATTINYTPTDTIHHNVGCTPVDVTLHVEGHITLSSEYTTATLISNTEAALPSYSDCFGCGAESCSYPDGEDCTCTASRDLADDESSYSIRRFKYKFKWATPLVSDCNISWIERTYDSDGNPVSDSPMSETVSAGETESTVYEVMEPTDNGTIGVVFPIGPCCTAGVCSTTDEATCEGGGGTYGGDGCVEDDCTPDPC